MKTRYIVEVNHRAMNKNSLYDEVRRAMFDWHVGKSMVRSVSVVPQPAQPQDNGSVQPTAGNKLQAAVALLVRCESSFSASDMEKSLKNDIRKFINRAQLRSDKVAKPKPENLIGACDGCKHDLPDGSEKCNECCRNESLSDCYSSPASA